LVARDEVGELYRALGRRLEHIVRFDVHASDVVIEEACQFAWCRLIDHAGAVRREAVLSWLVRTAVREAFKLIRRANRYASLEEVLERGTEPMAPSATGPQRALELRERIAALTALPQRQQRIVWLHALGLSYNEIALHTGCTRRTVERQLLRAKHRLRDRER
jgi:RNA polymerase sigma factor (sigma-70 family)